MYDGITTKSNVDCVGIVDYDNMSILITEHSEFELSMDDLEDLLFTVEEECSCKFIDIYLNNEDLYVVFELREDGFYEVRDYVQVSEHCQGYIDYETSIINITKHTH